MSIGIWEFLILLLIALIVFGAGNLPKVMGDLGKGLRTFKREMGSSEPETGTDSRADEPHRPNMVASLPTSADNRTSSGS